MHPIADKAKLAMLCMQRFSWEQGTAMQALLECGDLEAMAMMAEEAAYRSLEDGRVAMMGSETAVNDPCACGEGMIVASAMPGHEHLKTNVEKLLSWSLELAPRSEKGILFHLGDGVQFWNDSLYMLPPFLCAAGKYDEALHQLYGLFDALRDPETGLLRHIWDEGRQEFADGAFWGSGNGWALAGIARVIAMLPPEKESDRQKLISMNKALLADVIRWQNEDGSYHDIMDKPESFKEWNLSQMVAYAMYRGMADGWLEKDWLPKAEFLFNSVVNAMDDHGRISPVCGAPFFNKPGYSVEAQAFFLLMDAARDKCLAKSSSIIY
ncbi:MAG: glycosyl hydrolase [Clostridiales bacterium]|nr:glycosyl hydrolase [Clostridiales bacterium]